MAASGIIAEYNPFHNGHAYHIAELKRLHGGPVVVVLSGDFVQRGEAAIYDKRVRTRQALENGADMVLQLPTVYSLGSAQRFACGAVDILARSGIIDTLCFGSECGDLASLSRASEAMENEEYSAKLRERLQTGVSYPRASADALGEGLSFGPNDILALEYIRALREHGSIAPLCIRRSGAEHDSSLPGISFASAAFIRKTVLDGDTNSTEPYVPSDVFRDICEHVPRRQETLSALVLYALRRASLEELAGLPDVCEGLENVLYREARACSAYNDFLFACKTKRYTLARLRRISMCVLLSICKSDLSLSPYIRVLGIKKEARPLLRELCKNSSLPVVVRHSDLEQLSPQTLQLAEIDKRAWEIAFMADKAPLYSDYARPLIVV